MEKITKKKKTKKGLKKRIGLIAIGGLSLVLTICLSVGATLAWFAGSTWSSNQLYMGGPVYVEMAGRGSAGGATGTTDDAKWVGGAGNLDIKAATSRKTGTNIKDIKDKDGQPVTGIPDNILLPGQKFEIYSQARVFSTAYTSSVGTNSTPSGSSGANTTNTEKNGTAHITDKGRVTSTTTSVLRARFSISIDFDPSVGFNNFTQADYSQHYPQQSKNYTGHVGTKGTGDVIVPTLAAADGLTWNSALGTTALKADASGVYTENSRRDAVSNNNGKTGAGVETRIYTDKINVETDLKAIKNGTLKSIYKWKFVSASDYDKALGDGTEGKDGIDSNTTLTAGAKYAKMAAPFDGSDKSTNSQGYYGCWILTGAAENNAIAESDAFYKARCNSYIDSYVEEYITEYGDVKTRTIGDSIKALENSLNQSFVQLVNDSSDAIRDGKVFGMTVAGGKMTYAGTTKQQNAVKASTQASWLYIDPLIGNDTNTSEISTSTGGWWYLVESDGRSCKIDADGNSANKVTKEVDGATATTEEGTGKITWSAEENNITTTPAAISRNDVAASNAGRLEAKLFEINPLLAKEAITSNNAENDVTKVVSYSFPFVNGTSALPADALTNVFANAKITFQISFQAIQAFFPYSTNIDKMDYKNPLLGTAKALNIKNAIPIYNEAFDYQENVGVNSIVGL